MNLLDNSHYIIDIAYEFVFNNRRLAVLSECDDGYWTVIGHEVRNKEKIKNRNNFLIFYFLTGIIERNTVIFILELSVYSSNANKRIKNTHSPLMGRRHFSYGLFGQLVRFVRKQLSFFVTCLSF